MDYILSTNTDNSTNLQIIDQLCKTIANITIRFVNVATDYDGCFLSDANTILINHKAANKGKTLQHELLHWAYEYEIKRENENIIMASQTYFNFNDLGQFVSECVAVVGSKWGKLFLEIAEEVCSE